MGKKCIGTSLAGKDFLFEFDWEPKDTSTCQSNGSHTQKDTLVHHLYYSQWNHNLLDKHHAVLEKMWN